ncbi:TPA: D-alanyl-D-alanine carboxypeptidase PBP3 [Streptococcus agalactiae]
MKKIITSILLLSCIFFMPTISAESFNASAKHALAVDLDSGKILYEKDANKPAAIASLTKIMTVYMVYKEIDNGNLKWNTKVNISDSPYQLTRESDASNVPLEKRRYTVKQLVDAAMISSANSAAIALAEHISGTESKFVDKMTAQLEKWGIHDSHLVNASGLNNSMLGNHIYPKSSQNDENKMSARDIAIVAYHLVNEYPSILKITSKSVAKFDKDIMHSYNYMLPDMPVFRPGITGLKTGTTELAGQSFIATSTESGMRLLTVIMHADKADKDKYARFTATNSLLNYITNTYEPNLVLAKGAAYKGKEASVRDGKEQSVIAVAKNDLKVVQKRNITKQNQLKINFKKELTAPITKKENLGKAYYVDLNKVGKGYLIKEPSVHLVAKDSIERSFFLKVWWNHFVRYVNEKL